MKLYILIGTRPNFIKVTQFKSCAARLYPEMKISIVHTGQHYDEKMSNVFFDQFGMAPDHYLNIGQVSPSRQIAEVMIRLEELVNKLGKPDLFLVAGDVNSTAAGALFANKAGIKLGHIEAGLRSFDSSMPEEHNRIITDHLSDYCFTTERSAEKNLKDEKKQSSQIYFVGNTMVDTTIAYENEINGSKILDVLGIAENKFVLMTMHRPSTVDLKDQLLKLIALIEDISQKYIVVFPIHPRTSKTIKDFGLQEKMSGNKNLICTEPLDYFSFQKLVKHCAFVLTDSGGIQEETTFLQKPCLTFRSSTERPVTVQDGSNTLLGFDIEIVRDYITKIETGVYKNGRIPELWDGKATERILKVISNRR